jgi:hypothetical protein
MREDRSNGIEIFEQSVESAVLLRATCVTVSVSRLVGRTARMGANVRSAASTRKDCGTVIVLSYAKSAKDAGRLIKKLS